MSVVEFLLNDAVVACPEGLTVAAALFHLARAGSSASATASAAPIARITPRDAAPRSLFCGMGVCFDCVMEIDGRAGVRSCMTLVRPGMRVRAQHGSTALPPGEPS